MLGLIVIAVLQIQRMESNCYELIGVDRFASAAEVSRAFRKQSIQFHPDRPAPTQLPYGFDSAGDVFIHLQKCHETVSDPRKLDYYNRFGKMDFSIKNESTILPVMAVFALIGYIVNFVVCFVFTSSKESKPSRTWIYSFLVFAFSSEMYLKYLGQPDIFSFVPYLSKWMVFEQVEALKNLIPAILSSGLLLSQLIYMDESDMVNMVFRSLADSNREIAQYVVTKRVSGDAAVIPPPTPAVIKLMQPVDPVPAPTAAPKAPNGTNPATPPPTTNNGVNFQQILNWLFWAYVAKVVVGALRDLI